MYYIFATFNALAFFHTAFFAPETKGFTLEEMDDVFNSGLPAWKTHQKKSRLDDIEREIAAGNLKVTRHGAVADEDNHEVVAETEKKGTAV